MITAHNDSGARSKQWRDLRYVECFDCGSRWTRSFYLHYGCHYCRMLALQQW